MVQIETYENFHSKSNFVLAKKKYKTIKGTISILETEHRNNEKQYENYNVFLWKYYNMNKTQL